MKIHRHKLFEDVCSLHTCFSADSFHLLCCITPCESSGRFFFGPPGIIGNWCHQPSRFYESVAQCPCGLNDRKLLRLFAFCCLSDEKRLRAAGRSIVATGDIRARLKLGADTAVASSHVRLLGVDISLDLSVDRHVSRVSSTPAYPAVAGL